MQNASHTIWEELYGVAAFIAIIWAVFAVSRFIPSLDSYGVVPRTLHGLIGIPAAISACQSASHPGQHVSPVRPLGPPGWFQGPLVGDRFRRRPAGRLAAMALWTARRPHRGQRPDLRADCLLDPVRFSGKAARSAGHRRHRRIRLRRNADFRRPAQVDSAISWDGHLCGAIAGGIVAYALTRQSARGQNQPAERLA